MLSARDARQAGVFKGVVAMARRSPCRLSTTNRKVRRSECLIACRAIRRATQHQTWWRQREPAFLAFCPSDLPVKISKAFGSSSQHDSSPKRSRSCALRRYKSFCKSGCGSAAPRSTSLWGRGRRCGRALAFGSRSTGRTFRVCGRAPESRSAWRFFLGALRFAALRTR
jgi:hypothetical protein